jgi:Family of unknown function (DUF6624)
VGDAMRAALFAVTCTLLTGLAAAQDHDYSIEDIAAMPAKQRANVLAAIRNSDDADSTLLSLETAASLRADARRQAGEPPLFRGCLRAEEFELGTQLALARAAYDSKAYRALVIEYRRLVTALNNALAAAQASGNWKRKFSHLGHWIEDWRRATDPRVRELLRRTLLDQAIRASLSSFEGVRVYGKARATAALRAYDEYLFNRMCTADENNLNWLKGEVAHDGWFDIPRYGSVADNAAWLMVLHADGDPDYQAYIAAILAGKARSGETNSQNFANLTDRIAVRVGLPQKYATQMECVDGAWLAPNVAAPEQLDARRAEMGLPPYRDQVAQRGNLHCGKQKP